MREILFRGKHKGDGGWIYGVPIQHYDGDWQICTNCNRHTVNPQTIGQYTGLTDKNGKKIFEGDVVRTKEYGKIIRHANVSDFDTFRVVYSPCTFRLERNNPDREFMLSVDCRNLEVIGNIHDSPELVNP